VLRLRHADLRPDVQVQRADPRDGLVHTLYVYIFTSLEIMLECLKDDLLAHEGKGVFQTKMTYPRLIADFM
jgi:hypothetical protein